MGKKLVAVLLAVGLLTACLPLTAQAAELEIAAPTAILMEASTGTILYEKDAHRPLPPASVTKVMTLLLVMEALDSGRIGWDDTVIASEAAANKGGSQVYLEAGEAMSMDDMLKSVVVSSANDCATALAEHIAGSEGAFVSMMNERAAQLGLSDTHFVNCTGLDDDPDAAQHLTSAHDIAVMSRELLRHVRIKDYTTIWMDTVRNGAFGLSNTNKLIRFYQGATGLKTGFTSGAGYCLSATAQRDGMELIAVVMGADTSANRNAACKQLLDYGFANYAVIQPELAEPEPVAVKLGKADTVEAVLGDGSGILIDKAQKNAVAMELSLEGPVTAPVSQGQRVGTLTIRAGEQVLKEVPLVASEGVERLSFGDLFTRVFQRAAMARV